MDAKTFEKAAKTEALGWVELSEDPVPITWAGCARTLKRGVIAAIPVAAIFGAAYGMKLLGWFPQPPG